MPRNLFAAQIVTAAHDERLSARVLRRVPLRYAEGADMALDRPAHVRAASGLAWLGDRLAVIQDDTNFVALVDPESGEATSIALPPGAGGLRQFDDARGNKGDKLDLEAVASVPTTHGTLLAAIGSGSTAKREYIALIRDLRGKTMADVHHVPAFFAALRAAERFAGTELNVEGALYTNGCLRLFSRGNGLARDDMHPVNATCDVAWPALAAHLADPATIAPPPITDVVQYELGELGGVPLGFTDAAVVARGSASPLVLYIAAAEASPDAVRDGPVSGSAIGIIEVRDDRPRARWTELRDGDGAPLAVKVEGIALVKDSSRAFVVIDHDRHAEPSELCEVALDGFGLP